MKSADEQIAEFMKERNEALLSLDEWKIRGYLKKWNGDVGPAHPEAFWRGVHKAITAIPGLPLERRLASKAWLDSHGSSSHDDGDL
jgi:hypothetical protein